MNNLMFANDVKNNLESKKQKRTEDLFGFGGILKGLDLPTNKKELRSVYHERRFA